MCGVKKGKALSGKVKSDTEEQRHQKKRDSCRFGVYVLIRRLLFEGVSGRMMNKDGVRKHLYPTLE